MRPFGIGIGVGVSSGIRFGARIGYGVGHDIDFPSAGLFGAVLGGWRVIRVGCSRHSPITGFDSFEPERSLRALRCLPLQNMVKEVFYDGLVHVPWVSEFEPRWEIFRIDE